MHMNILGMNKLSELVESLSKLSYFSCHKLNILENVLKSITALVVLVSDDPLGCPNAKEFLGTVIRFGLWRRTFNCMPLSVLTNMRLKCICLLQCVVAVQFAMHPTTKTFSQSAILKVNVLDQWRKSGISRISMQILELEGKINRLIKYMKKGWLVNMIKHSG
jgi:hypothetical protein